MKNDLHIIRICTPLLLGLGIFFPRIEISSQTARLDSLELNLPHVENDSLRMRIYHEIIWEFSRNDTDRALALNADFYNLAVKNGNEKWLNKARYYYGVIFKNKGEYPVALTYLDSTIHYHRSMGNEIKVAHSLYQIGVVRSKMGQAEKALAAYNESIEIYREVGDLRSIATSVNAKGYIFRMLRQHEKGKEMYLQAFELHKSAKDTLGMSDALHNLGNAYKSLGVFDSALIAYNRCESMHKGSDEWWLGYVYENRGDLFQKMGELEKAQDELKTSIHIRRKFDHKGPLVATLLHLGVVQSKMKHSTLAIASMNEALGIANQHAMLDHLRAAHKFLANIYEERGDLASALDHYKQYETAKDSIFNDQLSSQFAELETVHQTKEKQAEIAKLEFNRQLDYVKLTRQRDIIVVIGIAALLLIALLWRLSSLNNKIKGQNKIITQALDNKSVLLKEIHHRVKNNLQLISSLLSLQSSTVDDNSAIAALTEGQSRVQSMALIHQDLYRSDNLSGVQIEGYVKKLCQNLFDTYNIKGNRIKLNLDIAPLSLDVSTLIPMGLILNELISNSLKYAFPNHQTGSIGVILKPSGEKLLLEVWDDGVGYSDTANTGGFGHKLIRTFAKKLSADVQIDHSNGTIVSMNIANFKVAV